jgi:phosphate starvation-inducible membrane PsiE
MHVKLCHVQIHLSYNKNCIYSDIEDVVHFFVFVCLMSLLGHYNFTKKFVLQWKMHIKGQKALNDTLQRSTYGRY